MDRRSKWRRAALALLLSVCSTALAALPSSCARAGSEPKAAVERASHKGVGVVKAVNVEKKKVKIDHEKIEGFMEAMTMWFVVRDAALLEGLAAGDRVEFTVIELEDEYIVTEIAKR